MLQCTQQGDTLTVHLCGEIDHCAAEGLRNEIEMQIVRQNAKRLILDFSQVTFMDSSGVGMIIGRYKTMHARGLRLAAADRPVIPSGGAASNHCHHRDGRAGNT